MLNSSWPSRRIPPRSTMRQQFEGARRLAWMDENASDLVFVSALLTAPVALTGLKQEELRFLRNDFEKAVAPEAADERPWARQALDELDRGTRNAVNKICEAAGLKSADLVEKVEV